MLVIPIIVPDIDFDTFLATASKAIGQNISTTIDKSNKKISPIYRFLISLSEFQTNDRPSVQILRDTASLYAHISLTFLFIAPLDVIMISMSRTRLKHTLAEGMGRTQIAVVSGTLDEWKAACLECCSQTFGQDVQEFYNQVVIRFEELGIKELWSDTKKTKKGNLFLLEKK